MGTALSIIGVAFAAVCIWLTVRIVNRRERWVKWTVAAIVGLPLLYVATFGPACWLCNNFWLDSRLTWTIYRPVTWSWYQTRPSTFSAALVWWCDLVGKDYRESQHGYGLPRPLHHEVAAQNPGVRWL